MNRKEKIAYIQPILDALYPEAACTLDFRTPHELLVSVQLAAQCTDARVNVVTKELFVKYPDTEAFAKAELSELEEAVKPCGFYRNKAKNIKASSLKILEDFGGKVPDTMEDLLTLPGVGRKTANLILGDVYGKPAVVVDTHCIRLTNRMGLTKYSDPVKIEFDLKKIIPPSDQSRFCHQMVLHGRAVCSARSPKCAVCPIASVCTFAKDLIK